MDTTKVIVRKAAVLGAGVMGAQIAAHLVNANVETILFELPAEQGDPNASVIKAVEALKKHEPAPLSGTAKAAAIQPANYGQDLALRERERDAVQDVRAAPVAGADVLQDERAHSRPR